MVLEESLKQQEVLNWQAHVLHISGNNNYVIKESKARFTIIICKLHSLRQQHNCITDTMGGVGVTYIDNIA